jgi:hypothetical protein
MFVAIGVVACWLGYELNWIRQRREFMALPNTLELNPVQALPGRAPAGLWIFGERGYWGIQINFVDPKRGEKILRENRLTNSKGHGPHWLNDAERAQIDRAKSLFPEATDFYGQIVTALVP